MMERRPLVAIGRKATDRIRDSYTVRPYQSHLRLKTTACDYEKIFRSTSATDPISIFVFVLREL